MKAEELMSWESHSWASLYNTRFLEVDQVTFIVRIWEAQAAIRTRAKQLQQVPGTSEERQALKEGLTVLDDLQRMTGSYDWLKEAN